MLLENVNVSNILLKVIAKMKQLPVLGQMEVVKMLAIL
jgi:hypothetical protein